MSASEDLPTPNVGAVSHDACVAASDADTGCGLCHDIARQMNRKDAVESFEVTTNSLFWVIILASFLHIDFPHFSHFVEFILTFDLLTPSTLQTCFFKLFDFNFQIGNTFSP